jgi:predicted alpha/beta superfamily hydrolase
MWNSSSGGIMLSYSLAALLSVAACSAPVGTSTGDSEPSGTNTIVDSEIGTPNPPLTVTIQSSVLGEKRRVYVQLPEGYERSRTRYPVLVVLDGEWLFELARSHVRFASEYEVMDVTIPKMIVVGIENIDRDRDYVPTEDRKDPPDFDTAGQADDFLRFLDEELFPMLDRQYRTAPSRIVVGWSFGGLSAMYSAIAMPDLFDAYLCIGPAIWWDGDLVFEQWREARFDRPKRMVVTLGSNEEGGMVHTSTTRWLERLDEEPVDGLDLTHLVIDGVGHSWSIPSAIDRGLRALFSGFIAPEDVTVSSIEEVQSYYRALSTRWGFRVDPPVSVMQSLAMKEFSDGNVEQAITVLEELVKYEPDAALAFFYLGKYHSSLGHHELALECYRNALGAELRRDVPKGIFLQPYRRAVEKAEAGMKEEGAQH